MSLNVSEVTDNGTHTHTHTHSRTGHLMFDINEFQVVLTKSVALVSICVQRKSTATVIAHATRSTCHSSAFKCSVHGHLQSQYQTLTVCCHGNTALRHTCTLTLAGTYISKGQLVPIHVHTYVSDCINVRVAGTRDKGLWHCPSPLCSSL